MTIEKHDLLKELPDHHHTIRHLKMHDKHFVRLFDSYEALTSEIYRMETGIESPSDDVLEIKKRERVQLKDSLFSIIKSTEAAI
jgi:uncharacterized protein